MSTTIDSKVVEMRFDNKNFESNVADTMSTINKLQQSLKFTGATKGLEGIDEASKKVNMSGLSSAIEAIQSRFSALEVMGITALANLTNSAVNAGKRMISALTVEPIMSGFSEYETKMGSIQTIMANTQSKGTTMEDVTRVIGDLNTYADKTIYNFAEMTRNIGTFTAAGIGLEESATAIQGIANLAAVSGSNSQQASTAMYQLSQAMAAGTVKLMDWNSVVNAGMGGQVFQDALKTTARAHGVAVDKIIEKNGSFRESLQEGWITTEILTETLAKMTKSGASEYLSKLTGVEESQIKTAQELVANNKDGTASYDELAEQLAATGKISKDEAKSILTMADNAENAATKVKTITQLWDTLKESAQSGWSQTWEILVGDFEEAKEVLTQVSDVIGGIIGKSADARNNLLQGWKDAGGRDDIIASFSNIFDSLVSIATPIKEAFREIFPPTTVDQLKGFTEAIKNFTEKLKLSDESSDNLKRTFKGLFAILDIVKQAFSAVFKIVKPLVGVTGDLGGGFLGFTAKIGDALVKFNEFIKSSGAFNKIANTIITVIELIRSGVSKFVSFVKEKLVFPGFEVFHNFLERIHERMSQIVDGASKMESGVSKAAKGMGSALENCGFIRMLETIWNGIKTIGGGIAKAIGALTKGIADKVNNADYSGLLDLINTLSLGGIAIFVTKFVKGFSDIVESAGSFTENIIGILDSVKGCFEAYQTQLKAGALLKIASAIGILAASILVISLIDSDKLSASLGAITVLFADLMGSMALFDKMSGTHKGMVKATTAMIGISVAVLILASALKKVADLDIKQLGIGLLGVAGLMGVVVGAAKLMSIGGKTIVKGATQMVIFAAAVKILASVCEDLSELSWNELAKGLLGVGVLIGTVSLFLNNTKLSGKAITTATGIVILGAAMKILASTCADFGNMKWGEIGKGLASIGALLAEVTLFTKFTGNAKHVISTGIALIAIGAAMKIFVSAIDGLSGMNWVELGKGLAGIAGALLAVTLAVNFMPKNMIGIGVGLIAVSTAILIMTNALTKMGSMSWEEIAKGLLLFAGSIGILALGLNAMTGTLAGSAALLVATSAILLLTPALAILGAMSWEAILKGLASLAGVFVVLGVAGALLTPVVPAILGLAGSLALIGVGVLAVGAGLLAAGAGISAIAIGLTALGAAVAGSATAIVAGLAVIIMGIVNLIPEILVAIGHGIIDLCGVIAEGAPAIGEAVKAIILSVCDVVMECTPVIADTLLSVLSAVMLSLATHTPVIVDSLMKFLIGILDSLASNMPALVQSAVNLIMSFFSGVVDALSGIDVDTLIKGIVGVGLIAGIMLALGAVVGLIPAAMVGVLGMGAVIAEMALVLAGIGILAQLPGLEWLINEGGDLLQSIGTAIGKFIGGIAGGFATGVSSQFAQIGSDLSAFMINATPFIEGAKLIDASAMAGVKSLVETILLLTAANILDGLTSWFTGGSSLTAFGQELAAFGPYFAMYAASVAGIDPNVVQSSANAVKVLSEMAAGLPNSGGVVGWFAGENSLSEFGKELSKFGPYIKSYADQVKGIDSEAVTSSANAVTAISDMAANLPNQGGVASWFAGDNTLSTFGAELAKFGPYIKKYSDGVKGIDIAAIATSAVASKSLFKIADTPPNKDSTTKLVEFGKNVNKFGEKLKSYGSKVAGMNTSAIILSVMNANRLIEMCNNMNAAYPGAMTKFAESLDGLGKAGVKGFVDAFKDSGTKVTDAGKEMVDRFIKGVDKKIDSVNKKFGTMLDSALETINKKYTNFYNAGKYVVTGFANGINDNTYKAVAKAKAMAAAATRAAEEELDINSPSVVFSEIGGYVVQGLAEGIDKDTSAEDAAAKKASNIKTAFQTEMDKLDLADTKMDLEKSLNGVGEGFSNAQVYAAKYERQLKRVSLAQGKYDNMLKHVGESSAETQRAYNELLQEQIDLQNMSYQHSSDWIEQQKASGDFSLVDELSAWKRVQAAYVEGTSQRIEADSKILSLEQSIEAANDNYYNKVVERTKELSEAQDGLTQKYKDAVEERKKAITGSAGLFDEVETKDEVKGSQLIDNLMGQLERNMSWSANINNLSGRGILSEGLITQLREMGPAAAAEIEAMANMTDSQLQKYNRIWEMNNTTAENQAVFELQDYKSELEEENKKLIEDYNTDLETLRTDWLKSLGIMSEDTTTEFSKLVTESIDIIGDEQKWGEAGADAIHGILKGITDNESLLHKAMSSLGGSILATFNNALGIESPSKEFAKSGKFIDEGLTGGIVKHAKMVYNSVTNLGTNSIKSLSDALSGITDLINWEMNTEPVITPVIDLSGARDGVRALSGMFGNDIMVGASANIGAISSTLNGKNPINDNSDVVSAIDKLRGVMKNIGGTTYNINGVTYDDGSNISDAIETLVRAAKMERRR